MNHNSLCLSLILSWIKFLLDEIISDITVVNDSTILDDFTWNKNYLCLILNWKPIFEINIW